VKIRQPTSTDEELFAAEVPSIATTKTDEQRVEEIAAELAYGFAALSELGTAVSVFGSARTEPATPEYQLACDIGRELARAGFAVITGGGPGAMEAANRGAREGGGKSVGLNIELPHEQHSNEYLDVSLAFEHFFARKIMFVRFACAFVVVPGGFGTMDELFEALTLIQTGKIRHFPIVLVGRDYWTGLVEWLEARMLGDDNIEPSDIELLTVVDDPAQAVAVVRAAAEMQGLAS
jgi:uncharacterized protein (TIGR00730 family)